MQSDAALRELEGMQKLRDAEAIKQLLEDRARTYNDQDLLSSGGEPARDFDHPVWVEPPRARKRCRSADGRSGARKPAAKRKRSSSVNQSKSRVSARSAFAKRVVRLCSLV